MINRQGRARTWLGLLLALLVLAAGVAWAGEQTPVPGGGIVQGSIGDATSMIPMITSDAASHEMSSLCYNGLLKYDKDLKLVGELAKSWEVSPDGLTITFHLRSGVRFHDGQPYTAQDALFNYQFMVDPKTPTAYAGDYLKVASAEAPDDHTFRVHYKEVFAPALASWGLSQMPAHLLRGKDVRKSPLNRHPIGTGPYLFDSWEPGARVTLKAYPDYFEGAPQSGKSDLPGHPGHGHPFPGAALGRVGLDGAHRPAVPPPDRHQVL